MSTTHRYLCLSLATAIAGFVLSVQPAHAQQAPFVPDVEGQFNALAYRPDALGFDIGNTPDPTTCKHYEGIARLQGPDGTPYFVLTRSGLYVPPCFLTDDEPGSLTIVRMGSREKTGERLRSNRLKRGSETVDTFSDPDCTGDAYPGCLQDVAVAHRNFNGAGGWPRMGHPESMQVIGNILVVGVDTPLTDSNSRSSTLPAMRVLFMDASDPENLQIVNEFVPKHMDFEGSGDLNGGIVSIARRSSGRYLLMITGAARSNFPFNTYNEKMWFFESNSTTLKPGSTTEIDPDGATDLTAQPLTWRLLDVWQADGECTVSNVGGTTVCLPNLTPDETYAGQNWPVSKGQEHQMFNFIRQGDENGTLYLAGARGGIDLVAGLRIGDDIVDLYRVDEVGDQIKLKLISSKTKDSHPSLDATLLAEGESNFAAASGFHISPSGEIIFYATAHENGGPADIATVGEWRHHNMVRPDSPTYLPGVKVFPPTGGEFTVQEGDSTVLAGLGQQPATKAWIQLYEHGDYAGRYLVVDFLDWSKDDYDDFGNLDGSALDLHFGFNNEASSARWFAPYGTHIQGNEYPFSDGDYPGDKRIFDGLGYPDKDPDLGPAEDDIMSVEFQDDVAGYYSGTPDVFWDVNLNGTFSTAGVIATFPATELDGPGFVQVPVKAVHPVDGLAGYANAPVRVLNVAPAITQLGIFNSLNQQLGVAVPFFLEGLPVTVRGSFTDPGKPDHQTADINWGDGVVVPSAAFNTFTDAFGGATGQLSHTRTYAGAGSFNLTLGVTDDDGGATAQSVTVPVLTAEQALVQMIETLDQIIAGTTDPKLKKILLDARKALQWNGASGAIDKLDLKNPQAALVKLGHALDSLRTAQAAGAPVGSLIALIEQVMASLR
jgi:hypothetical protein